MASLQHPQCITLKTLKKKKKRIVKFYASFSDDMNALRTGRRKIVFPKVILFLFSYNMDEAIDNVGFIVQHRHFLPLTYEYY